MSTATAQPKNLWTLSQAYDVTTQLLKGHGISREQLALGRVEFSRGNYTLKAHWIGQSYMSTTNATWTLDRLGVVLYTGRARITNRRLTLG